MKKFNVINIICIIISLFLACAYNPSSPDQSQFHAIQFHVKIPDMNQESLHITLNINNWEQGDSVRLLAPPIYADNPLLEQSGINFCNVSITDTAYIPIAYNTDSLSVGVYKSLSLSFPSAELPAVVEYDVKFLYGEHPFMPIPHINSNSGYLQGNYIFAVPYTSNNIVDIWRSNFDIQVSYSLGSNVRLYGDPTPNVYFRTPYELMFSTSVLLASSAINNQFLFDGKVSGQAFRFINISPTKTFSDELLDKTNEGFITILEDITPKFGSIGDVPFTIITGINDKIGLEGMYAFCLRNPWENDSKGVVNMTMAHEFLHSWIGIRIGEYDASWWKEGTIWYLGFLIAKRNNLCTQSYFEKDILVDLEENTDVHKYSLSKDSDYIREHIFTSGIGHMVYRKGAQVSMLIDRRITEETNNTITLVDVLAEFTKQYNGKAFYTKEYIAFIENYSGAGVTDIFTLYVDGIGVIPDSVLQENYKALGEMGALGDYISSEE